MNAYTAVLRLTLQGVENHVLAAASNSLTGFGNIGKQCLAYPVFKQLGLIEENGLVPDLECLLQALSIEINARLDVGTFV